MNVLKFMRRRLLSEKKVVHTLTLSSTGSTVASSATSKSFTVKYDSSALTASNVSVSSNQTWCTPSWSASSSTVKLSFGKNTSAASARTATVTVGYSGLSKTYRLTQNKGDLTIDGGSIIYCPPSGITVTRTFQVNGTDVSIGSNNYTVSGPNWITISKGNSGFTATTISDNTGSSTRSGTITVTYSGSTQSISVSQQSTSILCSVRFSNGQTYSYTNWPSSSTATPIGVVIPGANAFMALKDVSKQGSKNYINFGGYGFDIADLQNITTINNVIADMNGKSNTAKILAVDNSQSTAWQTASTIDTTETDQYIHPQARACYMYTTAGTSKGEWYLPSAGQLYKIIDTYSGLRCTLSLLNAKYGSSTVASNIISVLNYSGMRFASSTEYNANQCWIIGNFMSSSSVNYAESTNKTGTYVIPTVPFHDL